MNAPLSSLAGWHPLADGGAPAWASEWGEDRFGPFAAFEVGGMSQILRWIPAGRFRMGSPPDEPGRWDDEGPRHWVTLTKGFWLFDTPCTQALWRAVMGDNPSRFVSETRPVDHVSWNDAQHFLERINGRVPGLLLTLPTEAQWERACRAQTDTAIFTGPIDILGANNAPALDPIAWYGGNSGEGFELESGFDSSGWSDKQYPHQKAGTRPVRLKAPNGWGLYDMIGDVWEWCEDGMRDYRRKEATDPVGPTELGARRVLRGGSGFSNARLCRSASRNASDPADRDDDAGFRCARVQA